MPEIIKKHPILSGFVVFTIITLFPTIDSYWDLAQKFQAANMHINWYQWVFPALPLIGLVFFAYLIWQVGKIGKATEPKSIILSNSGTSMIDNPDKALPINYEQVNRAAWYSTIFNDDQQNISDRIYVVKSSMQPYLGNRGNPFLEFSFDIINATMFQVEIGNGIEGRIIYENERQHFPPEIKPLLLNHGARDKLVVKQPIFPEVAKRIQDKITASGKEGAEISFWFQSLQIPINVLLPDKTPLKSNHLWQLCIQPSSVGDIYHNNVNLLT